MMGVRVMTLDELEAAIKEARSNPYVDGRTKVKVLNYEVESVRVTLPIVGLDGTIEELCVMTEPFVFTLFPIL